MSHADPAKKLGSLLKKLCAAAGPVEPLVLEPFGEASPLECDFLYGFLLWDSNSTLAKAAYKKLTEAYVDMNHLRVAMPEETALVLGERYPKAEHRAARLRASLQEIFKREHTLSMGRSPTLGKREMRHYLDSLEGMHGFVAARLLLHKLGCHAIPLDDRLRVMMTEEHAIDPALSLAEAQHWLEHQVPAENAATVAHALQCWLDTHPLHRRDEESESKPKSKTTKAKAAKPARPSKAKGTSKS